MIQARRLGHVVLSVRDADKSKEFYTRTLGLQVAHEDRQRGAVFLSFGREHHDLALFQLATGEPPQPGQPGLHHMAWQLGSFDELQAAYRELKAMGVPVEATVEQVLKGAEKTSGSPIKIAKFARYALGEGIDKKDGDFAAEVAAAVGKR